MKEIEPAQDQLQLAMNVAEDAQVLRYLGAEPNLIASWLVAENLSGLTRRLGQNRDLGQRLERMTTAASGTSQEKYCTRSCCPCRKCRLNTR